LEYELGYLDTFLQKLPAKKWNKVPEDLKEESKRILDHLRSHDPTKRYDYHYAGALSLLFIIREVLGKKINIDFLPFSLQRLLPISMLNCFGQKAIINMSNYIHEKATKQCI
jgi:hypothetical protein